MDIGRAGPNKHSQAELSTSRVSASLLFSSEALKRNRRDDELTEDRQNQLQAPPPPPLRSTSCPPDISHDEFPQAFHAFCHSSTSVYYCEPKLKSKKQGRPGNDAKLPIRQETREGND